MDKNVFPDQLGEAFLNAEKSILKALFRWIRKRAFKYLRYS
ncbi:hypothetical protein B481_0981 [Planococcus halocryophilus Or1]|nr:hypothetical protein B481_0981 [Planococcus halocryophilus Or1]